MDWGVLWARRRSTLGKARPRLSLQKSYRNISADYFPLIISFHYRVITGNAISWLFYLSVY